MFGQKVYVKNRQEVTVASKFIYCVSIYKMWRRGASLIDEKYYASMAPIDFKKTISVIKRKDYDIQRFIKLESAPEQYLIEEGYKIKNYE